MPDIRDDIERLRGMARACGFSGDAARQGHYLRLIAWIETADAAMRAVVEIREGGYQGDSAVINTAFDRLRAALLPEVER